MILTMYVSFSFSKFQKFILWSLDHMMNVDRRRRFAFGTTNENTDTRIWFFCREIALVTYRFDYMKVYFGLRLLLLSKSTD